MKTTRKFNELTKAERCEFKREFIALCDEHLCKIQAEKLYDYAEPWKYEADHEAESVLEWFDSCASDLFHAPLVIARLQVASIDKKHAAASLAKAQRKLARVALKKSKSTPPKCLFSTKKRSSKNR